MLIVGAGGLASELLQVLAWKGVDEVALFDDLSPAPPPALYGRFPVLRSLDEVQARWRRVGTAFVVGVGLPASRAALTTRFVEAGGSPESVVCRHARVAAFGVEVGRGACVMPDALVMVEAVIGEGALVNKGALVSHHARIGRFSALAPGTRILGHAAVGELSEVGANAVVLPGVKVGAGCKVGAGAVVTRDVPDGTTVIGNPAEPLATALRRRRHEGRPA